VSNLPLLEKQVKVLGRVIGQALAAQDEGSDTKTGFALFLFDMGEGGHMTYVSNAKREDMIKAIKETLVHLEHGVTAPHGQPNHPANNPGKG
jgi:hypothetical protein